MHIHTLPARLILLALIIGLAACGRRPADAQVAETPTSPPATEVGNLISTSAPAATEVGDLISTSAPAATAAPETPTPPAPDPSATPDPNVDTDPPTWDSRYGDGFGATEIAATSMTLAWPKAIDKQGAVTYQIYAGVASNGLQGFTPEDLHLSLAGSSSVESYTVSGLTQNTVYNFLVIAVDAAGNKSPPWSRLTLSTRDNEPPSAPTNFHYVPEYTTSDSLYLQWTLSTDNSWVTHYELFVDGTFSEILPHFIDGVQGTAEVTSLKVLQTYDLYIVAVDRDENRSAPSEIIRVQIPDTTPPEWVFNLHVTARDSKQIMIAWDPCTDNVGVTEYLIYHDDQVIATTHEATYTFTKIPPDPFYLITVRARDQSGNESESGDVISITDSPVR